ILFSVVLTYIILPDGEPSAIFSTAAVCIGVALVISTVVEATGGIRNLIRVDILMLWALYGLTFLEFLFPQPMVDGLVSAEAAQQGTHAVLLGFAGLVIGRHLVRRRKAINRANMPIQLTPQNIFILFVVSASLGYLHILIAVNFDIIEAIRQMGM